MIGLLPKWVFSGMTALIILSVVMTISTIPNEFRSLRGTQVVRETFKDVVMKGYGSSYYKVVGEGGNMSRLPSDEFFVKPKSTADDDDDDDAHSLARMNGSSYSNATTTAITPTLTVNVISSPPPLQIAWLMSFPNSGTSYTITLVRHLTLTSTATNYGAELDDGRPSVPVFDDQPTGPFWYDTLTQPATYQHPTRYVLTKTHCGLRCEACPPQNYVETTFSFRRSCLSGGRINSKAQKELVTYPSSRVVKAIHLIRDPFDNVVSRFHLERRKTVATQTLFPSSKEGFLRFCQDMNAAHASDEYRAPFLHESILTILRNVPCRADFIRYMEWHNLAFATARDMELDTYVLHYESYASQFNTTTQELVDFLDLTIQDQPAPFESGKSYGDYFTQEQRNQVQLALRTMASMESWKHIERYFE